MKKLLSIMLTVSLVLALVPATFAVENEEKTPLVYDLTLNAFDTSKLYTFGVSDTYAVDPTGEALEKHPYRDYLCFKKDEKVMYSEYRMSVDGLANDGRIYNLAIASWKPVVHTSPTGEWIDAGFSAMNLDNTKPWEIEMPKPEFWYANSNTAAADTKKLGRGAKLYSLGSSTFILGSYFRFDLSKSYYDTIGSVHSTKTYNENSEKEETVSIYCPYMAIRIKVPAAGVYKIDVNGNGKHTGSADVHFVKADENYTYQPDDIDELVKGALYVGTSQAQNNDFKGPIVTKTVNCPQAGEYIVLFTLKSSDVDARIQLANITLTPTDEDAIEDVTSQEVTFMTANDDNITATLEGKAVTNGYPTQAQIGNVLKLSNSAENFKYWVTGSADNGEYYSAESDIEVSLLSNVSFAAIYADEIDENTKTVAFFNQDSSFIDDVKTTEDTLAENDFPLNPTLKGFSNFLGWFKGENDEFTAETPLEAPVTRVVAQFDIETGDVLSNSVKVNGTAQEELTYEKEIPAYVPGAKCWKRDGRLVAYGESYNYFVWDNDTEIISSEEVFDTSLPIIILDKNEAGEYMIEYDRGEKEILDVGILFGSETSSVTSFSSKASVRNILSHGQFTATKNNNETGARGYLIYKDGDSIKIIYAD